MYLNYIIIILFVIVGLTACDSDQPSKSIKSKVLKTSRDGVIDQEEFDQLLDYAKAEELFDDCSKLKEEIIKITKKSRKGTPEIPDCANSSTESNGYSVYIENSNSMMGYINGPTEFKEALMDLPSRIQGEGGELSFFFINDKPHKISGNFNTFINKLDEKNAKKIGNTRVSELDNILSQVTNESLTKGNIAILASDFIYDMKKGNPKDVLPKAKYAIKANIQKIKSNGDFGILILRMKSRYKGYYYDYLDRATRLDDQRPYYIWIMGKVDKIISIHKNLNLTNLKGFEDFAVFYDSSNSKDKTYYSVLQNSNTTVNFKRPNNSKGGIHQLQKVKLKPRKEIYQFTLAIDLSNIPVSESYLDQLESYEVKSSEKDRFEITSINQIKNEVTHKNDQRFLSSATHIFTIQSEEILSEKQTLNVKLRKQIPLWVNKYTTDDDSDIKKDLNKTLGLNYIIEGVSEAFNNSNNASYYINLPITITK